MADFRVGRHGDWRAAGPRPAPAEALARPPPPPAPPAVAAERLASQVRALGAWGMPARVFDRCFGAVAHRRRVVRLGLLVALALLAALLVSGGVRGGPGVVHDLGSWRSVGEPGSVHAYIAPGSSYRYVVDVAGGGQGGATFGADAGRVSVPSFQHGDHAYGLELRIVRLEPHLRPHVLVSTPGESLRTVVPTSDDGVLMRFEPGRFLESGRYQVVLTSKDGVGPIELRLAVVRAPLERFEGSALDVAPVVGGGALALVALGAVAPGAKSLRERRRLLAEEADRFYAARAGPEPLRQRGFARIRPFRSGVLAWARPGRDVPEDLARLPGHGWVIRLD